MEFPAVNELPLHISRENSHDKQDFSTGFFLKLLEHTHPKVFLQWQNGYLKTRTQKITETLSNLVLQEVKNITGFEWTNKRWIHVKNLLILIRVACNGIPEVKLIDLLVLRQLDAEFITKQILQHLSDWDYKCNWNHKSMLPWSCNHEQDQGWGAGLVAKRQ